MTTSTQSLAGWLLERIAEDEAVARSAMEEAPALSWETEKVYDGVYAIDLGPAAHSERDSYGVGEDVRLPREIARHITNFAPARVLAECEAKRQIVEKYQRAEIDPVDFEREIGPLLALPYADHADYDESWRP